MLRIALCDDNRQQRGATGKLLLDYGAARPHLAVKVSVFSSGLEVLAAAEEAGDFDLYVLDVVMPGLSGIQLGMRLREVGSASPIIYLTVSPEYAVDSYATRAFHYLMKPVQPETLFQVLDEAVAALEKKRKACIAVKSREGLRRGGNPLRRAGGASGALPPFRRGPPGGHDGAGLLSGGGRPPSGGPQLLPLRGQLCCEPLLCHRGGKGRPAAG